MSSALRSDLRDAVLARNGRIWSAVVPVGAMRFRPTQVEESQSQWAALDWSAGDYTLYATTLKDILPGERMLIIQTEPDAGLVGVWDFSSSPRRTEGRGYAAFGVYQPVKYVACRDLPQELLPLCRRRGRCWLTARQRDALARVVEFPPFLLVPPYEDEMEGIGEDWWPDWDGGWLSEREMQVAISKHPPTLEQLGISGSVELEVRARDGRDRYDVVSHSDKVIVECKLSVGKQELAQLVRYLDGARRNEARWTGQMVAGRWISPQSREESERTGVGLWRCAKGPDGPALSTGLEP
jgi:hypothetical protein